MTIYFKLLTSFFKIGLFGFGGGYAMLPLIKQEIVDIHSWLSLEQFVDIVAISQITPGPIAINSATFVGYLVTHNILGSAVATLGVCLPPFIIMFTISKFYLKFKGSKKGDKLFYLLKPAVVGLIGAAAISMLDSKNFIDHYSVIIFSIIFIGAMKKVDPIKLILAAGITGMLIYS
jgi:chromate transporter